MRKYAGYTKKTLSVNDSHSGDNCKFSYYSQVISRSQIDHYFLQ